MSKTLTIKIPDEVFDAIRAKAVQEGRSAEELATEWLAGIAPKSRPKWTPEELEEAERRLLSHAGSVDSGDPNSADNERIDADLAREYGNDHEDRALSPDDRAALVEKLLEAN